MATPKEIIDPQWHTWLVDNPAGSAEHVDTEELRRKLIEDLTFVSSMDVKEYTLYQKWCEIQERYPTAKTWTLFGPEKQMVSAEQERLLKSVRKTFWMPESPEDYLKLKPVIEISNGDLAEYWNAVRTFSHTMKNNSNIGRNLYYTVKDQITGKLLGITCMSSDFLDLTPRDKYIGWDRTRKTEKMVKHTTIASTIVPTQPLGFNYVGGKLLALLCLSDTVQKDWKERYGDILVGVTTTSLYGKTKVGGLSQYDGLDHWEKMGFSSGSVAFEPSRATKRMLYDWIKENNPRKFFELWVAKNADGMPFKRDHKNRSLNLVYSELKIPRNLTKSDHQRGIYFSPLYTNTNEFLREEIDASQLLKAFDTSTEALTEIWRTKHAKGRISMLKKKNNVSKETLFYDDLIFMSWEDTKKKYLAQIGR